MSITMKNPLTANTKTVIDAKGEIRLFSNYGGVEIEHSDIFTPNLKRRVIIEKVIKSLPFKSKFLNGEYERRNILKVVARYKGIEVMGYEMLITWYFDGVEFKDRHKHRKKINYHFRKEGMIYWGGVYWDDQIGILMG